MTKIQYERVKFRNEDKTQIVFLRVTRDSAHFLTGIEIDREGEEIEPSGFNQRIRMIDKRAIVWRKDYVMNLHYGELEPKEWSN